MLVTVALWDRLQHILRLIPNPFGNFGEGTKKSKSCQRLLLKNSASTTEMAFVVWKG
jgi:hypothetical protein